MPIKDEDRILIVEDDQKLGKFLTEEIQDLGKEVQLAKTVSQAREIILEVYPQLVITDLRLPGEDGFELLKFCRAQLVPPEVVMITAFGEVPQAVKALKLGAADFLTKPIDLEHLHIVVERALRNRKLKDELHRLRDYDKSEELIHGLCAKSRLSIQLVEEIRHISRADGPVLIAGESGVGKELVASAIHQESARSACAFLPVNCASLSENDFESEFFGDSRHRDRPGYFEQAAGGVLFLDEVADLPPGLQAKLLRVLEEPKFRRVGDNQEISADLRIMAATNRDLEREISAGNFREDLFYRLEAFQVYVAPLRDRPEDIEQLALQFVEYFSRKQNKKIIEIDPEAMSILMKYSYPGNVRELKNVMERAVSFAKSKLLPTHLPGRVLENSQNHNRFFSTEDSLPSPLSGGQDSALTLAQLEAKYIEFILRQVDGNKQRAAALLGIGRKTLYRKLKQNS